MAPKGERAPLQAGLRPAVSPPLPQLPLRSKHICAAAALSEGGDGTSCRPRVTARGAGPSGATRTGHPPPPTVGIPEGPRCVPLLAAHTLMARHRPLDRLGALIPRGKGRSHPDTRGYTRQLWAPPPSERSPCPKCTPNVEDGSGGHVRLAKYQQRGRVTAEGPWAGGGKVGPRWPGLLGTAPSLPPTPAILCDRTCNRGSRSVSSNSHPNALPHTSGRSHTRHVHTQHAHRGHPSAPHLSRANLNPRPALP